MISPALTRLAEQARGHYARVFEDTKPPRIAFSPGRVNLIGEHTDYVGGFCLPFPIDRFIVAAFKRREDKRVRVYSGTYDELLEFQLSTIRFDPEKGWVNYVAGVFREAAGQGHALSGVDIALASSLPASSGLSSSAALEAVTMALVSALSPREIPRSEWVGICHRAENKFVGVPCGTLDQTAVISGAEGHATFLDIGAGRREAVAIPAGAVALVADTATRRSLGATPYARKRKAAEEAFRKLRKWEGDKVPAGGFTLEHLKKHGIKLPTEEKWMAEHVLGENQRVLSAIQAFGKGDHSAFGKLLNQSHESLRAKVGNSTNELEAMRDLLLGTEGVYGARVTGAGFGGCILAWVEEEKAAGAADGVLRGYRARFSAKGEVFLVRPAPPAGMLEVAR